MSVLNYEILVLAKEILFRQIQFVWKKEKKHIKSNKNGLKDKHLSIKYIMCEFKNNF